MKNYEEMAQNVLKRRDIEIKRRRRAFLIGAPCAAAVLVGVVGIGAAVASSPMRGSYLNLAVGRDDTAANDTGTDGIGIEISYPSYTTENAPASSAVHDEISNAGNSDNCIVPPVPNDTVSDSETSGEIAPVTTVDIAIDYPVDTDPPVNDYTNPNAGVNDIKVLKLDEFKATKIIDIRYQDDFVPYTLENLDSFYGLRFNRLGELYPNWKLSYNELGIYRRETNDGFVAKLEMYNTCNTLKYTTENGAEIEVAAQYGKFEPVSDEMLTGDKPVYIPEPAVNVEYDENGNVIGMSTPAYDPTQNPNTPTPDEGVSTVNGYEALIYRDANGFFLADLDMGARVRITAEGLSEEEFLEVLDNFTR